MWLLKGKTMKEISTYFFRSGFKKRLILNFLCLPALIVHDFGLGNKGN